MAIVAAPRLGGPPRSTTDQPLKGEYPSPHIRREESFDVLLYTQQGIRIICGEDRQNEQSDMTWVKRFIIFLVVGFALFYLVAYPEAAGNAVCADSTALRWYFARSSSFMSLWPVSPVRS
jgi:hypothetical protein